VGGIQNYLWELWRRLPAERVTVLTTPQVGDREFDAAQPFRVVRAREPVLLPVPSLARRIRALAGEVGAGLVVLDPALPVGALGPALDRPYAVVVHGAEVSIPARLPVTAPLMRRVLRGAALVVAAGEYVRGEAQRAAGRSLNAVVIPPGVDIGRFRPLDAPAREAVRMRHGLPPQAPLVVGMSRLVPRKGFDVLIAAAALLARDHPDLVVAIAGGGRDEARLARLAEASGAPVRFLGRVSDADLPGLLACADVFAAPTRRRWGGLEQEGFGIVFVEAAACGVPQVAGDSGGAAEAVAHGETGLVVREPNDPWPVADALAALLRDGGAAAARMGVAARQRAVERFDYDRLAAELDRALAAVE
jgi:phosphatidylinositol alpha-1,6-mannosyltransferase